MKKTHLLFSLLILLVSCNYKLVHTTTREGKHFYTRRYMNSDISERYYDRVYERHERKMNTWYYKSGYLKMSFERYNGNILTDTINDYTWFQFDTTRIYLLNHKILSNEPMSEYGILFNQGIINDHIIFCESNFCKPFTDSTQETFRRNDTIFRTGRNILFDKEFIFQRYGWASIRIMITNIEHLYYLDKGTYTKVFKMEHKYVNGGPNPDDNYYLFELTNMNATRQTNFEDFVKGSSLTFFKLVEHQIEI